MKDKLNVAANKMIVVHNKSGTKVGATWISDDSTDDYIKSIVKASRKELDGIAILIDFSKKEVISL